MSAPLLIAPATPAEISLCDRFREAEHIVAKASPPTTDEMIDVCLAQRMHLEMSAHAAATAYGTPFDARIVRHCVVLQRIAEFLGLIAQHKDEVKAVLQAKPEPRLARRA